MLPRTFRILLLSLLIFDLGCGPGSKDAIASKGGPPLPSASTGIHSPLDKLLTQIVHNGRVDYEQFTPGSKASLLFNNYLASIAGYGPNSHPADFSTPRARAAYYLNAHIALGLELARRSKGDGIVPEDFERPLLQVDGSTVSAANLESLIRNQVDDPRVIFLIARPTVGGPPVLSNAIDGTSVNEAMVNAAAQAIDNPQMVKIDHETLTIQLSEFFEWYQRELVSWVSNNGGPSDPKPFEVLIRLSDDRGRRRLNAAIGYRITVAPYDWTINRHIRADEDILAPYRAPLYFGPPSKKP